MQYKSLQMNTNYQVKSGWSLFVNDILSFATTWWPKWVALKYQSFVDEEAASMISFSTFGTRKK